MKRFALAVAVVVLGITSGVLLSRNVVAQTLHSWSSGQVVAASDLNGNFTALKTTKIGGGVQLGNADVSTTAAIVHSKMATPALLPKAWGVVTTNCTGSTAAGTACTVGDSSAITSITTSGTTGIFRVNLSYTPTNSSYAVLVTSHLNAGVCIANSQTTSAPHVLVKCFAYDGTALDANQFSVLILDT